MSNENGKIMLARDIKSHWIYDCKKPQWLFAWITLLIDANWKDSQRDIHGTLYEIKRGDVFFDAANFADKTGLGSGATVSRFIDKLVRDGMVIKLHKHKEPTRLRIVNYEHHQTLYSANKMQTNSKDYKKGIKKEYSYICLQHDFIYKDYVPDLDISCPTCNKELRGVKK